MMYIECLSRVQFEGSVVESLQVIIVILPDTKWSCLLLRIVLQDALIEVVSVSKAESFRERCDRLHGKTEQGVDKRYGKILQTRRRKIEEKILKLSITKERKDIHERTTKKKGVDLRVNVEIFGVDLRTSSDQLGVKEEVRRRKRDRRFSFVRKNRVFQKKLYEDWYEEADGEVGGGHVVEIASAEWQCQKYITSYPLSASNWRKSYLSIRRRKSEKHQNRDISVEDFRDHVIIDDSLMGVTDRREAYGWSVEHLWSWRWNGIHTKNTCICGRRARDTAYHQRAA